MPRSGCSALHGMNSNLKEEAGQHQVRHQVHHPVCQIRSNEA